MLSELCTLLDPAAQRFFLSRRERLLRTRRRHHEVFVTRLDACDQFAGLRLFRDDGDLARFGLHDRGFALIQSQLRLPSRLVLTMTTPTVVRQNRPHVASEVDA